MYRRILLAGLLGASAGALAQSTPPASDSSTMSFYGGGGGPFSYDYVEGGAGEVDEGDALFLNGSKSLSRNVFVLGSAYMVDPDINIPGYDGEGFYVEGGIGYAMPMAPELDVYATAQLLYADLDVPGEDNDVGYITRLGLRYQPMQQVELEASAALSENDLLIDDGVGASGSARYRMTPQWSAAVGYSTDTELDGAFLNVRYDFR